MRRRLTTREWLLLALLGAILIVSGYILLFYMPVTAGRDRLAAETESVQKQTEALRLRLEEKRRMELELEELFSADEPPLGIANYDNVKAIMTELDSILALTEEYSLSFTTSEASPPIVRRSISMTFTASDYNYARKVLQRLHDSDYRCMLESVSLSFGQSRGDPVSVSGTIVFFEYQASPSAEPAGTGEASE